MMSRADGWRSASSSAAAAKAAQRLPLAPQTLRNNGPRGHDHDGRRPGAAAAQHEGPAPTGAKAGGKRMSFATERVRVAVRIRPLVAHEADQVPSVRCIDRGALKSRRRASRRRQYHQKYEFDLCLGPSSTEDAVFEALGAKALLDRSLSGIKATVFAYGATGSGKTHTILGHEREDFESLPVSPGTDLINDRDGLVARAVRSVLSATADSQLQIRASFFEVYCEQIYDLLEPNSNALAVKGGPRRFFRARPDGTRLPLF